MRASPVSRAGLVCLDLGTSVKHTKNQLPDYVEKSQPGQLESRQDGLKIYHAIAIAGPTLSRHYSASEQNGSPESRYFSFYKTH